MDHENEQMVIFGNPDHPETIGLVGQVNGDAVVVTGTADVEKIVPEKKVYLFSQTTMDPDQFRELESAIQNRIGESVKKYKEPFRSECTICGQMKKRKPHLAEFAEKFDLILFVSGKNSSNGKMLFEFCREVNPSTYWISGPGDIDPSWLEGINSVGISGATSTSFAQLEATREQVSSMVVS
jgi:4-hydroxy-3-methylbut-2-enyl diphosphate reductase